MIHRHSVRANKPLVTVNCAALPENLLESELFGHVKGAFTGAIKDRLGRFELANGGTIFLDEIGELPAAVQAKLLRILQDGEFEKLGESRTRKGGCARIVAATNRNLRGRWKMAISQDLFYRLNTVRLKLLLQERGRRAGADCPFFAEIFAQPEPGFTAGGAIGAAQLRLAGQRAGVGKCHPAGRVAHPAITNFAAGFAGRNSPGFAATKKAAFPRRTGKAAN
ncbi:MAG: sigma-54 factor interaction domain-containing protein [Calditrichia bacterium]